MDTIERQAALDILDGLQIAHEQGMYGAYEDYRKQMCELPSAQRWIPVSERLPFSEYGESDAVLATYRSRQWQDDYRWIKRLYYNGGVWCYPTGEVYEDIVTAWMPLPEPYQEESE